MAEKRSSKEKSTHLQSSVDLAHRGPGCWSSKGYTDQQILECLSMDGLNDVCTELDMSDNFITQRGASMLGRFIQHGKVSWIRSA